MNKQFRLSPETRKALLKYADNMKKLGDEIQKTADNMAEAFLPVLEKMEEVSDKND